MGPTRTITAYERCDIRPGYGGLSGDEYDALVSYATESKDGWRYLSVARGTVHAGGCAGVIVFEDTCLEILPGIGTDGRIRDNSPPRDGLDGERREALVGMVSRSLGLRVRTIRRTSASHADTSLLEAFIGLFADQAEELISDGVRRGYSQREGNLRCLKGRVLHRIDSRINASDRSRVYVRHTVFTPDCPENRLIRTCAERLLRVSTENRLRLGRICEALEFVGTSADVESDFASCDTGREAGRYRAILDMCRVFLSGHSYVPLAGSRIELSLMFDVGQLFEDTVTGLCLDEGRRRGIPVRTNRTIGRTERLYGAARMEPDVIVDCNGGRVILDAKWKDADEPASGDLYQMFAYSIGYGGGRAVLVYPTLHRGHVESKEHVLDDGRRLALDLVTLPLSGLTGSNPPRILDAAMPMPPERTRQSMKS